MVDWAELTLFLYIVARMSGFVLFNPILGRRGIPGIFMAGLVLVMAVSVNPGVGQSVPVPGGTAELIIHILLEMALGFLLGMVMNFFFYVVQLAGHEIDTQMGMTMNQIYDASSQANMSVSGTLLNLLMMLVFFAANGHHTLLRIMITSGEVVPFGAAAFPSETVVSAALQLFAECAVMGVKLCMPILVAELLGQIGMGVLMKVIPQINVFAINIDLKVLIGLGMLLLLLAPFSEFLLEAEAVMLNSLERLLSLSGG